VEWFGGSPEVSLACREAGQHFGEVELIKDIHSNASVRAAGDQPVVLKLLSKANFIAYLNHSPLLKKSFSEIVENKLVENRAKGRGL
jgi:CRP-like cAMP-binding protein